MAEAKTTFTTTRVWDDGKKIHAVGRLTVSASPDTYTTGGIAFDVIANAVDGAGLGLPLPAVASQPFYANINGLAYNGQYLSATKKLKLLTIAGVEASAAAIPAGLSGDTIQGYFVFDKLV